MSDFYNVTGTDNGGFISAWSRDASGNNIYGRYFEGSNDPDGDEFILNDTTTGVKRQAFVTTLSEGAILAVWRSNHDSTEDVYLKEFIPGSLVSNDNPYYTHTDHLGTPQVLTDATKAIVWQADYDPFGAATVVVDDIENNLRFPGQYYDDESGLHYNYFRDYDPSTGRYVQSDPIGLSGGVNSYLYSNSNSIRFIDPFGLTAVCPWRLEKILAEGDKWVRYRGVSGIFHCGFTGFLENLKNRKCGDDTPEGECFYDTKGNLVTIFHEWSGCRGTPNYAPSTDNWEHFKQDVFPLPGLPAFATSIIYAVIE